MTRSLALVAALSLSPACAHRQLTNRQVATGAVGAAALVGGLIVLYFALGCGHRDPRCAEDPPGGAPGP
jgi:hypothetical protein